MFNIYKTTLELLLEEMHEIEQEFKTTENTPGIPTLETIYDNPKFLLWRSKLTSELEIKTDSISKNIKSELSEFNGWQDKKLFENIKAELTVLIEKQRKIGEEYMISSNQTSTEEKKHKLFISHSSSDIQYIKLLVEMLEDIGMPDGSFVCTSIPGHGIPGGNNIYDWLREQFVNYDLRVLFVLSHNYYTSAACLNEMGAAWISKTNDTLLLLPDFDFSDIKGCLDSQKIGLSFNSSDDEIKHRLNELKDTLTSEYNLPDISQSRWERHRDNFITSVRLINEKNKKESEESSNNQSEDHQPVVGDDDVEFVPVESAFLLVYAAENDGQIMCFSDINGAPPYITVNGKRFMADLSHRESARWQEALDRLIIWGWVKQCNNSTEAFELTGTGYDKADMLKDGMNINTSNDPLEEIKEFDT